MPRTSSGSSFTIVRPATTCPDACEHLGDRAAAGVGLLGARIAHGDDEAAHGLRRVRFVLGRTSLIDRHVTIRYASRRSATERTTTRTAAIASSFRVLRVFVASCLGRRCACDAPRPRRPALNAAAERWVEQTRKKLTLDEKIGQLIVPSFESNFLSTDSETFDELTRLVRDYHVGGFHVFGASIAAPPVLLNPGYGTVILGQPFSAAFLINRLQALSTVPLAEHRRLRDRRRLPHLRRDEFPRQMAMGAVRGDAGDDLRLVREEARITGDRSARARRPRELRADRGREQQPAQSGDQHALVRRGSGAGGVAGRRVHRRRARRRDGRDDQAFSRAWRHRCGQPSGPAGDSVRSRTPESDRAPAVQARASSRAPRR